MELFTPGHLLVIAVVALVLFFGWKQLPDMARSLGRSLRVFKTEIKGMSADDDARKQADTKDTKDTAAPERTLPARPDPAAIEAPRARPRPAPSPNGRRTEAERPANR